MFEIKKIFKFEAGHVLPFHKGKCSRPHGHSYVLEVYLESEHLCQSGSETNMVIDFARINEIVNPMIVDHLDHYWLNDSLDCESPTAEFIARWIYRHLKDKLPNLKKVTLFETQTSSVTYWE